MFGDEYPEMADQLRANVSRFSAYKANYVRQAFDDNARQFSGKDLDEANKATINQFRRWTDAELTTAGARARTAKQFTEFNEPDRRELFPCLKWLPSRAVNPRQSHMRFYNRVWRKDDTFWDNNAPGTEWNCMCDIEECDDQPTDNSKVKQPDIPKGLEGNPSVTGEIFTDKASYIAKAGQNRKERNAVELKCESVSKITASQMAKDTLLNTKSECKINGEEFVVEFISRGIDHYARDTFGEKDIFWLKNEILPHIDQYIKEAKCVGRKISDTTHNTNKRTLQLKKQTDYFYYFEITLPNKRNVYLHLGRFRESQNLYLYTVTKKTPKEMEEL